jgi:hypothetical protein
MVKNTKMIYKILHRKPKIEQHKLYKKTGSELRVPVLPKDKQFLLH